MKIYSLENKTRVILLPVKGIKSFTLMVGFCVGSKNEEEKHAGISHFLEHMIFKGTKKRKGVIQISKELDSIGAIYNAFTGKEMTAYFIKSDSEYEDKAFDVLSDVLKNSTLPSNEIEKERKVIKEEIKMYYDMPQRHVLELYEQLVFKGSSLARDIAGNYKTLDNTKRKDIKNYIAKNYNPENRIVVVSGNFNESNTRKLVKKYFNEGGICENNDLIEKFDAFSEPRILVDKRNIKQVNLAMGFPTNGHKDQDFYAIRLLDIILGSTMGSRLNIEVREKRGLAYYVRTTNVEYEKVGSFIVHAGIDHARIDEAILAIIRELKKISGKLVSSKELVVAKQIYKGRTILGLENTENLAARYLESARYEPKPKTVEQEIGSIMKVNSFDIRRAAQKMFDLDKLSIAVVGPVDQKQIKNTIQKLKK